MPHQAGHRARRAVCDRRRDAVLVPGLSPAPFRAAGLEFGQALLHPRGVAQQFAEQDFEGGLVVARSLVGFAQILHEQVRGLGGFRERFELVGINLKT